MWTEPGSAGGLASPPHAIRYNFSLSLPSFSSLGYSSQSQLGLWPRYALFSNLPPFTNPDTILLYYSVTVIDYHLSIKMVTLASYGNNCVYQPHPRPNIPPLSIPCLATPHILSLRLSLSPIRLNKQTFITAFKKVQSTIWFSQVVLVLSTF